MAAGIFNFAKGRIVRYGDLPDAGSQLVAVLLQTTGIEADATLEDHDTLSSILGSTNTEASFTGYTASGQDMTGVTVIDNGTSNSVDATTDPQWSPTSAQDLAKIVICYDPDGTNTATSMIPLFHDDFSITTPTSGTITYQIAAGGFVTSS